MIDSPTELDFGFQNLTFIKSDNEILNQIENSVLLFEIFKEIQHLIPLGDALEKSQYGFTASARATGNCQMLRITDIKESRIEWPSTPYCSSDEVGKYALKNGDILIARTGGTTGKTTFVQDVPENSDVVCASYLIRLSVKAAFNPKFI